MSLSFLRKVVVSAHKEYKRVNLELCDRSVIADMNNALNMLNPREGPGRGLSELWTPEGVERVPAVGERDVGVMQADGEPAVGDNPTEREPIAAEYPPNEGT
jgi:hypothetical protein